MSFIFLLEIVFFRTKYCGGVSRIKKNYPSYSHVVFIWKITFIYKKLSITIPSIILRYHAQLHLNLLYWNASKMWKSNVTFSPPNFLDSTHESYVIYFMVNSLWYFYLFSIKIRNYEALINDRRLAPREREQNRWIMSNNKSSRHPRTHQKYGKLKFSLVCRAIKM